MGNVDLEKLLPPATDEAGNPLDETVEAEILNDLKPLPFDYVKDGKVAAKYVIIVDPKLIKSGGFSTYQRTIAGILREADRRSEQYEAEAAAKAGAAEEIAPSAKRTRKKKTENGTIEYTADDLLALADFSDLLAKKQLAEATFLAPAVVAWNVRNMQPTVDVLTAQAGPGPAALAALSEWFFPTLPPSEAATGKTETANTAN